MVQETKNNNLLIVAIVGMVAIVALLIFSRGSTGKALDSGLQDISVRNAEAGIGGAGDLVGGFGKDCAIQCPGSNEGCVAGGGNCGVGSCSGNSEGVSCSDDCGSMTVGC